MCSRKVQERAVPHGEVMVVSIDAYCKVYGVEPVCEHLPIAPSTYYEEKAQERHLSRRPRRRHRDEALKP